jgi:WD40 repeat protein
VKKTISLIAFPLIVLASYLTYYRLWRTSENVDGGLYELEKVFSGHRADVWSVSFSPDDSTLASASVDSTVTVWNIETGHMEFELPHPAGVTYVEFSPNGRSLASSSYDGIVRIWDVGERSVRNEISAHEGTAWSVSLSRDGAFLASGGEDGMVRLWECGTGKLVKTLKGHTRNVWDVKFSPDGTKIASGSFDNTIKIWDVKKGLSSRALTGIRRRSLRLHSVPTAHRSRVRAMMRRRRSGTPTVGL